MMSRHAMAGQVAWIGLRSARRAPLVSVQSAEVTPEGLIGDHARAGKRAVTLIQAEHLPVVAGLLGREAVLPEDLRRNIVVSGINLLALRHHQICIGSAILKIEGPCPPCSRMEDTFGPGGYSAVRGHGGVYASVVTFGTFSIAESVTRHAESNPI